MRLISSGILCAGLALLAGCGGKDLLAPVTSIDGTWSGEQNGYGLTLIMTQQDTTVSACTARLSNTGGTTLGTCQGSFVYPKLHVKLLFPGFEPATYDATMSQAEAKLFGRLGGSGITERDLDIRKQ